MAGRMMKEEEVDEGDALLHTGCATTKILYFSLASLLFPLGSWRGFL